MQDADLGRNAFVTHGLLSAPREIEQLAHVLQRLAMYS